MSKSVFFKRINKYELREEIIKSQEQGEATERLQVLVYRVAHKVSRTRRFNQYTEDWINEALLFAFLKAIDIKTINKYNADLNTSAYAWYFTSIKRAMIDGINKDFLRFFELKMNYAKHRSCLDPGSDIYMDNVEKE